MISSVIALDNAVLHALYAIRDPFLVQAFIWISELASVPTVVGFTTVAVILLAYRRRWALAGSLITSIFGSGAAVWAIKEIVARPRPGQDVAAYIETTSAFPSSHATLAMAFYGFLMWMFWQDLAPLWKKVTVVVLGALILAEGFARLYLGIHYPSDIVAGYLLGALLLWIGTKFVRKFQRS